MAAAKYINNTNATKTILITGAHQCMLLLEMLDNVHVNGTVKLTDSEFTHAINLKCTKAKANDIVNFINSNSK